MTRSSTLVVASEAEEGKPGLPTTQPSRSKTLIRRNVPALRGRSSGSALSTPMTAPLVEDASDRLNPAGTQSGLSRRSTVIRPASGSMSTTTLTGMPSSMPGSGSCELVAISRPCGQPADGRGGQPVGVAEPRGDELPQGGDPVPAGQLVQPPFADPGRAQRGQVVAVPDLRHPDPALAHPDDVRHVGAAALDPDAGEVQPAFLVQVLRERHVRGRLGVAAVRLVRLGRGGEHVLTVQDHRHQQRVIGGVRVAQVRVVVKVGVAVGEVRVQLAQPAGLEPGAENVHLQPLGGGQQLVFGGHDAAGEVAGHVQHRGPAGAEQGVAHLPDDRVEPAGQHGQQHRVQAGLAATSRVREAASAPPPWPALSGPWPALSGAVTAPPRAASGSCPGWSR